MRTLYEGGLSYGPYISLMPGIYDVAITGSNLESALLNFTKQYGAESYTLYNLQTSDTLIRYRVQVDEPIQEVEITVYNPGSEQIVIEAITVALQ